MDHKTVSFLLLLTFAAAAVSGQDSTTATTSADTTASTTGIATASTTPAAPGGNTATTTGETTTTSIVSPTQAGSVTTPTGSAVSTDIMTTTGASGMTTVSPLTSTMSGTSSSNTGVPTTTSTTTPLTTTRNPWTNYQPFLTPYNGAPGIYNVISTQGVIQQAYNRALASLSNYYTIQLMMSNPRSMTSMSGATQAPPTQSQTTQLMTSGTDVTQNSANSGTTVTPPTSVTTGSSVNTQGVASMGGAAGTNPYSTTLYSMQMPFSVPYSNMGTNMMNWPYTNSNQNWYTRQALFPGFGVFYY